MLFKKQMFETCCSGIILIVFVMLSFTYRVIFVQNHTSTHELCNVVGVKLPKLPEKNKKKLADRLKDTTIYSPLQRRMLGLYGTEKSELDTRRDTPVTNFYVLGQNVALQSIPEIADLLLKRDVNEVFNFDGKNVGPIFIPESYIPKKPRILDSEKARDAMNKIPSNETRKKSLFSGDMKHTESDQIERHVYDVLKSFYTKEKGETVLVIQGIDIFGIKEKSRLELDFLVINYSRQYILNIEVKKWLGEIRGKNKSTSTKTKEQLQKGKALIEDWFSADLRGNWKFVSAVYCNNMEPKYWQCETCSHFIAMTKEDLKEKIHNMENKIKHPMAKKYPEDLKLLCKYLLFCAPVVALPISGNMVTVVGKG